MVIDLQKCQNIQYSIICYRKLIYGNYLIFACVLKTEPVTYRYKCYSRHHARIIMPEYTFIHTLDAISAASSLLLKLSSSYSISLNNNIII